MTGLAAPYTSLLGLLRVVASTGAVCVRLVEDALATEGDPTMLQKFASFFSFQVSLVTVPRVHRHFEWFEGNEYVARESFPLVIGLR